MNRTYVRSETAEGDEAPAGLEGDPLALLVSAETVAEIVEALTPDELVVVALRLEGLTDRQIARLLAIRHTTVLARMARARERIGKRLPELRRFLEGRVRRSKASVAPRSVLEEGWICDWSRDDELWEP